MSAKLFYVTVFWFLLCIAVFSLQDMMNVQEYGSETSSTAGDKRASTDSDPEDTASK